MHNEKKEFRITLFVKICVYAPDLGMGSELPATEEQFTSYLLKQNQLAVGLEMQWCSPSLSLPNSFTGLCYIKHNKYTR